MNEIEIERKTVLINKRMARTLLKNRLKKELKSIEEEIESLDKRICLK